MSKKKGLFSWFSKKPAKKTEEEIQLEVIAQEKADAEIEAQKQEQIQAKKAEELAVKHAKERSEAEAQLQAKLAAEQVAIEAAELIAKEQAEAEVEAQKQAQLEALQAAKEAEALAAREKAAKEQAEAELAAQLEAKEKAEKELAAKEQAAKEAEALAAREQAAKEAEELAAREQAAKEAEELAAREQAAKEAEALAAREQAAKEAEELAAREQAAKEQAEAELAAQLEAKEKAEKELAAREQAIKEAEALAATEQAAKEAEELAVKEAKKQAQLAAIQAAKEQSELLVKQQAKYAYQEAQRNAELARQQVEKEIIENAPVESEVAPEGEALEQVKEAESEETKKLGFFARFAQGLKKTRLSIGSGLLSLFKGKKIDDELFEELEEQLIVADIGVETTLRIIDNLTDHADRKQLKDAEVLYDLLKKDLSDILDKVEQPLVIDETKKPYVILMVGVNGVGKTTTIGKLAKKYQNEGKSVMLAAGDTFRAAAVEQLQVWGERNDIPVIAQQTGADSASVLFDAMDAAHARGADVLIADTAGRLQNKDHLMGELAKVVRIMRKKDPTAPHEIMLTIDAGTGQNAISQVKLFNQAVGLTGITFTKLDGTAKGGIIFSIADQFKLPIRYIGVGEGIDDLRQFNAKEFIDALFTKEEDS